jgi:large-conductance mechanosensitive channel
MTMYIVAYRNATIKKNERVTSSHTSIQLTLMDVSGYQGSDNDSQQDAPIMVIIIAVLVGGLISSFCIGVVVYMAVKAWKARKEGEKDEEVPEEEQLNSEYQRR